MSKANERVVLLDLLARVGFDALLADLGGGSPVADEDDPESVEEARLADHDRVRAVLLGTPPKERTGKDGCHWLPSRSITWPDRVPGLKTWAGQSTLAKIIEKHQERLTTAEGRDLFTLKGVIAGTLAKAKRRLGSVYGGPSGLDFTNCPNSLEAGFSVTDLELDVGCLPAVELLAVIGLACLPLVSVAPRVCGVVHDRALWVWEIENRAGYYYRWTHTARRFAWGDAWGLTADELDEIETRDEAEAAEIAKADAAADEAEKKAKKAKKAAMPAE